MSHYITIPIDPNGVIDPDEQIDDIINTSMSDVFGTTDVFVYSHGWWTTADSALKQYNIATTDFISMLHRRARILAQPALVPFLIGIHWPSTWDDDPVAFQNNFEATSFYTMQKRADDIGEEGLYAILRLLYQAIPAGKKLRINLLGHSFGCKVICSALEKLAENNINPPSGLLFNVILLQAAFGTNRLDPGDMYGRMLPTYGPVLRLLITKSAKDEALGRFFPIANSVMNFFAGEPLTALGASGPSSATLAAFKNQELVEVEYGGKLLETKSSPTLDPVLVVADLTPVHSDPQNTYNGGWGGHHSDIFRPEIYDLMGWFLFGEKAQPEPVQV
jgi:hypothetical protein